MNTYKLTQTGPETQDILDEVNVLREDVDTNTIDIDQLQELYQAFINGGVVIIQPTDTWPVENPTRTAIYRVIDRENTPPEYYADYMWNGTSFEKMAQYDNNIDDEPTADSDNLVKSGGVVSYVATNGSAFDISVANASGGVPAEYADLADALGTNGANVPSAVRKGGMSVKFIQQTPASYSVVVTPGAAEAPTGGVLLDAAPEITSGSHTASDLTELSTESALPTSVGGTKTYYFAVTGDTTTYTTLVVTLVQNFDHKYVQWRYMETSIANADFVNVENWEAASGIESRVENLEEKFVKKKTYSAITNRQNQNTYASIGTTLQSGHSYKITISTSGWDGNQSTQSYWTLAKSSTTTSSAGITDDILSLIQDKKVTATNTFDYTPTANISYICLGTYSGYVATGNEKITIEAVEVVGAYSFEDIEEEISDLGEEVTGLGSDVSELKDSVDSLLYIDRGSATTNRGGQNTYAIIGTTLQSGHSYKITISTSGWDGTQGDRSRWTNAKTSKTNSSTGVVDIILDLIQDKSVTATNTFDYIPTENVSYILLGTSSGYVATGNEKITISVKESTAIVEKIEGIDDEIEKGVNISRVGYGIRAESASLNATLSINAFPYYLKSGLAMALDCLIPNGISDIYIGKGYQSYRGSYLHITSTTVEHIYYEDSEVIKNTYTHGLTISTLLKVTLNVDDDGVCNFVINTLGQQYSNNISNWGYEMAESAFVKTTNTITNVKLSVSNNKLSSSVWVIGDSYCGVFANRWPGQIKNIGYFDFMLSALAGMNSYTGGVPELKRCLTFSKPKVLLWLMMGNDRVDWYESCLNEVISICSKNSIELITYKHPNTPEKNFDALNAIMLSKNVRYIDFAAACTSNGSDWYAGYLSSDNVHPSELGAKAQALQVLVDAPEMMSTKFKSSLQISGQTNTDA